MNLCCEHEEVGYGKTVYACVLAAQATNDHSKKTGALLLALNCPELCDSCREEIRKMLD